MLRASYIAVAIFISLIFSRENLANTKKYSWCTDIFKGMPAAEIFQTFEKGLDNILTAKNPDFADPFRIILGHDFQRDQFGQYGFDTEEQKEAYLRFINRPDIQEKIRIGNEYKKQFRIETANKLSQIYPTAVLNIPGRVRASLEQLKKIMHSFGERHYNQMEADILARQDLSRRYGREITEKDVLEDDIIRQEFQRLSNRYQRLESYASRASVSRIAFENWKVQTLKQLREWSRENARVSIQEHFKVLPQDPPKTWQLSDPNLANEASLLNDMYSRGQNPKEALDRDLFESSQMELQFDHEIPKPLRSFPGPVLYLNEASGSKYAISSSFQYVPGKSFVDMLHSYRFYNKSGGERDINAPMYPLAPSESLAVQLAMEVNRQWRMANALAKNISLLPFDPALKKATLELEKIIKNAEQKKATYYEEVTPASSVDAKGESSGLFWWGLSQSHDLAFWENRHLAASAREKPYLYFIARHLVAKGSEEAAKPDNPDKSSSVFGASRNRGGLFGDLKPKNKKFSKKEDPFLQVRFGSGYEKPTDYLRTMTENEVNSASEVKVKSEEKEFRDGIVVESLNPLNTLNSKLAIPTPTQHRLENLILYNEKGEVLDSSSYQILLSKDEGSYCIRLKPDEQKKERNIVFSAFFKAKDNHNQDSIKLDPQAIKKEMEALKGLGFEKLAEEMLPLAEARIKNASHIELGEYEEILRNSARYSDGEDGAVLFDEKNKAQWEKFVKEDGVAEYQCDTAACLNAFLLNKAFEENKLGFHASAITGFGIPENGLISNLDAHAITAIEDTKGIAFQWSDATPWKESLKLPPHPKLRFKAFATELGRRRAEFTTLIQNLKISLRDPDPSDPIRIAFQTLSKFRDIAEGNLSSLSPGMSLKNNLLSQLELLKNGISGIEKLEKRHLKHFPKKYEHYEFPFVKDSLKDMLGWLKQQTETLPWTYLESNAYVSGS